MKNIEKCINDVAKTLCKRIDCADCPASGWCDTAINVGPGDDACIKEFIKWAGEEAQEVEND